ncbi:MAG: AAA family ATPase, partial [Myxococcota bacterium]
MAIRRLHIDGYLHFNDFELDLGPGLNVVHGPNEAGKSTLLRFVRYVLFGPPRLTAQRGLPLVGTRHGGTLWLDAPDGASFRVQRAGRELTLTEGGIPRSDDDLDALLGSFDQAAFDAVYACDLDDLQQMGALQADDLRRKLFASSVRGAAIDIEAVEARWQKRRKALATRGRSGRIWRLERDLDGARSDLEQSQQQARELPTMVDRLDDLERAIAEHDGALEAARRAEEQRGLVERVEGLQIDLTERLGALGVASLDAVDLADETVHRLLALAEAVPGSVDETAQAESLRLATEQVEQTRQALDALAVPGPALALQHRLDALRDAAARVRDHETSLNRLAERGADLEAERSALASAWPSLAEADPAELRTLRAHIEQDRDDIVTRQAKRTALGEDRERTAQLVEKLTTPVAVPDVPGVAWAERRATMAERLAASGERRAERDRLAIALDAEL